MTIDIRPMIEDVSQVMTKHITNILSGVIGEYTVYKETHDTIMGLPCVRKLQQRINELENRPYENGGGGGDAASYSSSRGCGASREDEIKQLQNAIVELNRYIVALESKTDMKSVCSSSLPQNDEESIRLEVHEDDSSPVDNHHDDASTRFLPSSNSKNVIVSSTSSLSNEDNDQATETTEDLAGPDVADDEAEEAEEEAEEAEEEEAEEEEAEEEAEKTQEPEEEEEAEEAEEAEEEEAEEAEEAEEEEAEEAEAEEAG